MPFTFSSGMFQQDVVASPCLSLKSTNSFFLNIVNTHGKPPLQLQNIKNVTESDKATCSRIHSSMESSDSEAPYLDNRCMCLNKATTPNKKPSTRNQESNVPSSGGVQIFSFFSNFPIANRICFSLGTIFRPLCSQAARTHALRVERRSPPGSSSAFFLTSFIGIFSNKDLKKILRRDDEQQDINQYCLWGQYTHKTLNPKKRFGNNMNH